MTEKKNYKAEADGWIAGEMRQKGDTLELTPAAAKYEHVELVLAASKKAPKGKVAS